MSLDDLSTMLMSLSPNKPFVANPPQLPEMLRCPLESIALRIKALHLGRIGEFLSKAIEPPTTKAITHVIDVLRGLSALEQTHSISAAHNRKIATSDIEELTPLGVLLAGVRQSHPHFMESLLLVASQSCFRVYCVIRFRYELAFDMIAISLTLTTANFLLLLETQLPVDPRIGKMMLFGAIFRCLEPTLVIAASLAFRSPFFSPFDKRDEVCRGHSWGFLFCGDVMDTMDVT